MLYRVVEPSYPGPFGCEEFVLLKVWANFPTRGMMRDGRCGFCVEKLAVEPGNLCSSMEWPGIAGYRDLAE